MSFFSTGYSKEKTLKTAEKLVALGKLDAAIENYEKALKNDPSDLKVVSSLGELYLRSNRTREATAQFLRLAQYFERTGQMVQATAMYKRINRIDPNDATVAVTLANLALAQGQTGEAHQYFLSAANACKRMRQFDQAIKYFQDAIDLDPTKSSARVDLADLLHQTGKADEAHDLYLRAGRELFQSGDVSTCMFAFRKALSARPGSKAALKALSDASFQLGDTKGATRQIKLLSESNPDDPDFLILLGRAYLNNVQLDDAETAFSRLVEIDPSRFEYLLEVGRKFLEAGQFDRTRSIVEKCLGPLLKRGQKKKATALLKEIVRHRPEDLETLQLLAKTYETVNEKRNLATTLDAVTEVALKLGRESDAVAALAKLVELSPRKKAYQDQLATLAGNTSVNGQKSQSAYEDSDELDQYNYSTELLESMVKQDATFAQARITMLENMLRSRPDYVEAHAQLKNSYLDLGNREKAAEQCLIMADIHDKAGNEAAAVACRNEAFSLVPSLRPIVQAKTTKQFDVLGPPVAPATSGLTGRLAEMPTADHFQETLEQAFMHPLFSDSPLSVAKLRVDNFSEAAVPNLDTRMTYLNPIAEVLEEELVGPGRVIAYGGGADFLILLPNTSAEEAVHTADALRLRIESLWLPNPASEFGDWLTASVGVVTEHPTKVTPIYLLSEVENALHLAITAGGNRVVTMTN